MRLFLLLSVAMMLQMQGCDAKKDEDSPSSAGAKAAGTGGGDAGAVGGSEVTDPPPAEDTDAKDPDAEEEPADEEPDVQTVCVGEPFVSVWRIRPAGETVRLPIVKRKSGAFYKGGFNDDHEYDASFDFTIDWGDGSDKESFSHDGMASDSDFSVKHAYEGTGKGNEAKDYEITIKGNIGAAWGYYGYRTGHRESANSLMEVKDLGDVGWTSLIDAFSEYPRLAKFAGGCTRNVRMMTYMFWASAKVTPDVSEWDTSSVEGMGYMFHDAESANPDVSNWDFSSIKETDEDGFYYFIDDLFYSSNSLSTENYSTLLKKLAADHSAGGLQDGVTGITLNIGTEVKYNADVKDARDHLVNEHAFEITDGGQL